MRIEGSNPWNVIENVNSQAEKSAGAGSQSQPPGFSEDDAQISGDARLATSLAQRVAAAPDVRREKVAQLKAAVEAGTYSVSDTQVAGAMLAALNRFFPG